MCTSLFYTDAQNRFYIGRTLELSLELPYQLSVYPQGAEISSTVADHASTEWTVSQPFLAVTMPDAIPTPETKFGLEDLKVIEGLNTSGLAFSVQSYPEAGGPDMPADSTEAALSAADLGAWVLGSFTTVAEVRYALANLRVVLEPVPILGGLKMPFHYAVRDASGDCIVIEFHKGVRTVYDNPVGVMTNAPQFSWHLTNLDNYTFLNNVDRSKASFGNYQAVQPGSGIGKAGVPASDTSVDRFVQAAYYSKFAEKQTDGDRAVQMVAHIMNNFDRPPGATVDYPDQGSSHLQVKGQAIPEVATEFTSWTNISDLDRKLFFLRDNGGMNYARFDVAALSTASEFLSLSMAEVLPKPQDLTASLT